MKKIYYLSSSIVCATFLFGATSANAALDCATVCQGDICGFSERLAKACIADCGKDPSIKACRAAARKAFSQSRRQKQEAAGEEIRKQRAAKRQNINQSEEQEENVDAGSLFNDNEVSNVPPIDETSNEPIIKTDEIAENQNSSEVPAPHQMRHHSRPGSNKQSHTKIEASHLGGDVCRAPTASITEAISILQNVQNCGGASGQEAPLSNIPDAPPPPSTNHRQQAHGVGSIVSPDILDKGIKNLRRRGSPEQRTPNKVNNNEATREYETARANLRKSGDRQRTPNQRPTPHNAAAKKAEQGTFHSSEGGNNFLDKLGQNVAGKVLKNVGVGGGGQ